tara:strand:+ start:737 stop:1195 length:459 start_codon:yes stop_codon:yes gene_type:complete
MKLRNILFMAALYSLPQYAVHADDTHHPDKNAPGKGMQGSTGMMENMQQMIKQMETILKTEDDAKRNELMQEHMQSMHEGMDLMRHMGGGMMKSTMGADQGMKAPSGTRAATMEERHQMMEQRMDMMQMMMEQMVERQHVQSKSRHDHRKTK